MKSLHNLLFCSLLLSTLSTTMPAVAQDAGTAKPGRAEHAAHAPVLDQLTPENSVVLLVDFQPQFLFSTRSASADDVVNSAQGLMKAAKAFGVPTVITTIAAKGFAGSVVPEIQSVFPTQQPIDRTVINAWSDTRVRDAVAGHHRKKLVIAGLWTDNCVMLPALSALAEGYEVYVVTDASGDYDAESHERAIARLVQAGAVPITWLPVMLEWQADWAHSKTAKDVQRIMRENAKALSAGQAYHQEMSK